MKKKEFNESKLKTKKELSKVLSEKKVELTKFTSKMYAGREKNLKVGKNLRRDIAQLTTIISQKGEEK